MKNTMNSWTIARKKADAMHAKYEQQYLNSLETVNANNDDTNDTSITFIHWQENDDPIIVTIW